MDRTYSSPFNHSLSFSAEIDEIDDEMPCSKPPLKHMFSMCVEEVGVSMRLDKAASILFPTFSRSAIEKLIERGALFVNGVSEKKRYQLQVNDRIDIDLSKVSDASVHAIAPCPIDFEVLYEDSDLFVINKAPGLVVHPAPGNWNNTVVHGLLHRFPEMGEASSGFDSIRPGIIHRLDKDTSGVLIIAKTAFAHWNLGKQFQERSVYKEYKAVVLGDISPGTLKPDEPLLIQNQIGRDPKERKRMAVVSAGGKDAVSEVSLIAHARAASYVKVVLSTGRTHQIRVHLAHLGFPILGDSLYGNSLSKRGAKEYHIDRQMLHCHTMKISHPVNGRELLFEAPYPADMANLLVQLKLK